MGKQTCDQMLFLARVAEQANQFEDTISFLEKVIEVKSDTLSIEEMNFMSDCFKKFISSKRNLFLRLSKMELKPKYYEQAVPIRRYKDKLGESLQEDYTRILTTIRVEVLQRHLEPPSQCFFNKLSGDFFRYLTEIEAGANLDFATEQATKHYEAAIGVAEVEGSSPIKLGAQLNYSYFCYEVLKDHALAVKVLSTALDNALDKIKDLNEKDFQETKQIIVQIKNNLKSWKEEVENNNVDLDQI